MKRTAFLLALILTLGTLVTLPISAEKQNIMSEFCNVVRGEWENREDALCSTVANGAIGDAILTSDLFIEPMECATVSVDITITGGNNGAAGFCIAELDPSLPIEGGCVLTPVDISVGQAKLFAHNAQTAVGSYKNVDIKFNETFNMRLEIYEDGTLEVYINDALCCQGVNTNFSGGYLGLYTFSGSAEFRNLTLEYDGGGQAAGSEKPTPALPGTYRLEGTNTEVVIGKWTSENGVLTSVSENVNNEAITLSDYYFEAGKHLTVTADIKITDGAALALLFAETSKLNPLGGGALIYNIDAVSEEGVSRLFTYAASYSVTDNFATKFELNRTYKLRLEIFADGDMEAYMDDAIIHNLENTGFTGGYLGLYTWCGAGTFENVVAVYGGDAPERNTEGLETTQPSDETDPDSSETTSDTAEDTTVVPDTTPTDTSADIITVDMTASDNDEPKANNLPLTLGILAAVVVVAVVIVLVIKKAK